MKFDFKIDQTANGYSAYVPGLPGCVAAAETREETEQLILEAINFHLEGLMLQGSILALDPIRIKGDTLLWTTDNTPLLYVEIHAPSVGTQAPVSPKIDIGAAAQ